MTAYTAFDSNLAIDYIKNNCAFFAPDANLSGYEFGDGNLNLVFRIADEEGHSVILKQALPYARCVGESWPLTLDRARIEAGVLANHGAIAPEYTAKLLHHNSELAVSVLEDLGHMDILRGAQIAAKPFPKLAGHVASYLARSGFYNSDFYLSAQEKKARVAEFSNPELCQITEDLFFTDPYMQHERNRYPVELAPEVATLQANNRLKVAVANLKARFLSAPQTLLHGDVHSGSIFVDRENTKLIDPEFGFFGPVGFDIGSFVGNLLLNYCSQNARIQDTPRRRDYQAHLLTTLQNCYSEFEQQWLALIAEHSRDPALAVSGYGESFMQQVLEDAIGYAGCELIRRTIGLAHVADINGIEDDAARLAVQRQTLLLGEQLILNASECHDREAFFALLLSLVH